MSFQDQYDFQDQNLADLMKTMAAKLPADIEGKGFKQFRCLLHLSSSMLVASLYLPLSLILSARASQKRVEGPGEFEGSWSVQAGGLVWVPPGCGSGIACGLAGPPVNHHTRPRGATSNPCPT